MARSIPISPKYGANPTIPICFWCGEAKNEIALLGRLKGDKEAPHNMILNYEPCDKCKENWAKGVALLKASKMPFTQNQVPFQGTVARGDDIYVNGAVMVIKVEALKRLNLGDDITESAIKEGILLMESEVFDAIWKSVHGSEGGSENEDESAAVKPSSKSASKSSAAGTRPKITRKTQKETAAKRAAKKKD